MKIPVPKPLKLLSAKLNSPIYLVGGYVRDYLLYQKVSADVDFCAPILPEELARVATSLNFNVIATYKKTGTVKLKYGKQEFEYTAFRTDKYSCGGAHVPSEVVFTTDITLDAMRRDFKVNAIYYDVKNEKIVDVLGGLKDIKNKTINTVISPEKVFMHDGLRLMRLARFSAYHNLKVPKRVYKVARKYKGLVSDITPDRIKEEFIKILSQEVQVVKHGLQVLEKSGVLKVLLKEQKALKISRDKIINAISKTPQPLRLYATCILFSKDKESAIEKLEYLRVCKSSVKNAKGLVSLFFEFINGAKTKTELKKAILDNFYSFNDFYALSSALISGEEKLIRLNARLIKWAKIKESIISLNIPISFSDLNISAKELIDLGAQTKNIKSVLNFLLIKCQKNAKLNNKKSLIGILKRAKMI